ncbi:MAG TPA: hypothetical protein ENJ60_09560 [Aeromonadales bacterium]|nr:hypothetical protein [Aeromonadales bacterium]
MTIRYWLSMILIYFCIANCFASNLSDFLKNTQNDLLSTRTTFTLQQEETQLKKITSDTLTRISIPPLPRVGCGLIKITRPEINYNSLITLEFQGEYETWTPILNNYTHESYWKLVPGNK